MGRVRTKHEIPDDRTYEDYNEMLSEVVPDIVSICVPPAIHARLVIDCAEHVDVIRCEKPMDLTWDGARRMAETCWRKDVQLTFNH